MEDATRADMQQWAGCIAGALTQREFEEALAAARLREVEIRETAAIIRARKPTTA